MDKYPGIPIKDLFFKLQNVEYLGLDIDEAPWINTLLQKSDSGFEFSQNFIKKQHELLTNLEKEQAERTAANFYKDSSEEGMPSGDTSFQRDDLLDTELFELDEG